ncbi:TerD family protein [Sediminitomix flava]|uniref:Tellurium resistance protein TerD n=1 Tax=Sediminitomix flava TaxID=379075 RepID=A0A315YZY8_SEDFL|nr:TerD family protein [Sediminitomix flava]PWJ36013.1 tellurium resistance protein TerD [Sediminitomix flava]
MTITLEKGGRCNLSHTSPPLQKVMIGLGWELKPNASLDLDASAFMLGKDGKLIASEFLVFYNNLKSPDGAIQHTGDNRTGIGDGDDEMLLVNLESIDPEVHEVIIAATIHNAIEKEQSFGLLNEAYIRLVNIDTRKEVARYSLGSEFSDATDIEFGRLLKTETGWSFEALGKGATKGLEGLVSTYQ